MLSTDRFPSTSSFDCPVTKADSSFSTLGELLFSDYGHRVGHMRYIWPTAGMFSGYTQTVAHSVYLANCWYVFRRHTQTGAHSVYLASCWSVSGDTHTLGIFGQLLVCFRRHTHIGCIWPTAGVSGHTHTHWVYLANCWSVSGDRHGRVCWHVDGAVGGCRR